MELKEKLVTLRKEKGLTQLAVAEKLGVSRQANNFIEITQGTMRATKTFEVTVSAHGNANANAKDSFSMEAGETVRIRGIYSPEDASMDFGLIDSAGVFHYVNVKDGSIDQTFKISESGTYRLGIRNNSGKTVTVSGFVRY